MKRVIGESAMLGISIFSPAAAGREQIVIAPHPDRLRRPAVRPGTVEKDRFHQTLLWNTFRTLELLPPAFWLRRLQARLHMEWFQVLHFSRRTAWQRAWKRPIWS